MEGDRVLVVGGGSGIGAATARLCAARGARVAVLDRQADGARRVAAEVAGQALVADVRDSAAVAEAVEGAVAALGGLTGVVNSAGLGNVLPLTEHSDREWARIVAVNLTGPFQVIRAAAPHLRASGRGSVVNVASVSAVRPTRGESAYSVAKAGLVALTQSAALELAPDIRVNAVSPGFVDTPLTAPLFGLEGARAAVEAATPLGRVGSPVEIAAVIVWLLSADASFVTGHNVIADGGGHLVHAQADPVLRQVLDLMAPGSVQP